MPRRECGLIHGTAFWSIGRDIEDIRPFEEWTVAAQMFESIESCFGRSDNRQESCKRGALHREKRTLRESADNYFRLNKTTCLQIWLHCFIIRPYEFGYLHRFYLIAMLDTTSLAASRLSDHGHVCAIIGRTLLPPSYLISTLLVFHLAAHSNVEVSSRDTGRARTWKTCGMASLSAGEKCFFSWPVSRQSFS